MLEKIDSSLIHAAQWVIRQIELYSPITKKHIEDFIINCYFWLILTFSVTIVSAIIVDVIEAKQVFTFGVLLLGLAPLYFSTLKIYKGLLKKVKKESTALPAAIYERKSVRIIILLSLPLAFLIIFAMVIIAIWLNSSEVLTTFFGNIEERNVLFSVCNTLIWLILPTEFLIEYLFCTTSLPPGEKDRKKTERETRNMIPIKN